VPLAFLVAVTDLIPLIGATLGAVICIAVALFATRLGRPRCSCWFSSWFTSRSRTI
jgi:predicted PurR-regulated permease PerM